VRPFWGGVARVEPLDIGQRRCIMGCGSCGAKKKAKKKVTKKKKK